MHFMQFVRRCQMLRLDDRNKNIYKTQSVDIYII